MAAFRVMTLLLLHLENLLSRCWGQLSLVAVSSLELLQTLAPGNLFTEGGVDKCSSNRLFMEEIKVKYSSFLSLIDPNFYGESRWKVV